MYQLWLSPKCMKIYVLPAKVYRYMWKMLFYSLRFLQLLPCTNKPHGNRFIIKSLHPSAIDLDEEASEIKVLNSAEHWGDPGPWEPLFFQCHQPNFERYLWAEAWKEQLECSVINTALAASEGHLSHSTPPTCKRDSVWAEKHSLELSVLHWGPWWDTDTQQDSISLIWWKASG